MNSVEELPRRTHHVWQTRRALPRRRSSSLSVVRGIQRRRAQSSGCGHNKGWHHRGDGALRWPQSIQLRSRLASCRGFKLQVYGRTELGDGLLFGIRQLCARLLRHPSLDVRCIAVRAPFPIDENTHHGRTARASDSTQLQRLNANDFASLKERPELWNGVP